MQDAELFVHYIHNIRDTIPTLSTCTAALVRANGRTYEGNYNRYLAKFAKQLEIYEIPSITAAQKAAATATKEQLSGREMEVLSCYMTLYQ